uniref:Uncharacterized protein n=1 Tax=Aegilops tauschii subsp. strangulata TaxID=200361 RepID=A0A453M7R1_AEGTS
PAHSVLQPRSANLLPTPTPRPAAGALRGRHGVSSGPGVCQPRALLLIEGAALALPRRRGPVPPASTSS